VASLVVELLLASGRRVAGVPSGLRVDLGDTQLDETGYGEELLIDGAAVRLGEVAACTILGPRTPRSADAG
jgi:hypothetical protein